MARYIHGFSDEEEQRLVRQAEFLAPWVFDGIDHSGARNLLEIGCAVGAELKLIHERWPHLDIWGVDRNGRQLDAARKSLASGLAGGKVHLVEAAGENLPFAEATFDRVITIWLLEHVGNPALILREARRVLRPGGLLVLTEVQNDSMKFEPDQPELMRWWEAFNRCQVEGGGDPFIGCKRCV